MNCAFKINYLCNPRPVYILGISLFLHPIFPDFLSPSHPTTIFFSIFLPFFSSFRWRKAEEKTDLRIIRKKRNHQTKRGIGSAHRTRKHQTSSIFTLHNNRMQPNPSVEVFLSLLFRGQNTEQNLILFFYFLLEKVEFILREGGIRNNENCTGLFKPKLFFQHTQVNPLNVTKNVFSNE